jgi:hypothetical protein
VAEKAAAKTAKAKVAAAAAAAAKAKVAAKVAAVKAAAAADAAAARIAAAEAAAADKAAAAADKAKNKEVVQGQRAYLQANRKELINMINVLGYPGTGKDTDMDKDRLAAQESYRAVKNPADRVRFLQQFIAKGSKDLRWAAEFTQRSTTTDRTSFSSEENYMTRYIYIYIYIYNVNMYIKLYIYI